MDEQAVSVTPAGTRSGRLTSLVFLVIGLALMGGGATAYYYIVQRPLTWPTAEAVVVSSRVVNPDNPSQYQAEIVFRYETAAGPREATTRASWSSSAYDSIRAYVERYPPGAPVTLAINPADGDDVRYELGASVVNLIVPGALGLLGAIFTTVGVVTLVPRAHRPADPAADARTLRRVATTFTIIGAVLMGLGTWLAARDVDLLREWPTVDAEVVDTAIVSRTSTSSRGTSPLYDVQVTFVYSVAGRQYESQTTTGVASSSRGRVAALLKQYDKGTHHAIRHRPDDPNVIRFDVSRLNVFAVAGGMMLMGLVFLGFGLLFRKKTRAEPPRRTARSRRH